jgi:hypothetical protein
MKESEESEGNKARIGEEVQDNDKVANEESPPTRREMTRMQKMKV